MSDKFGMPLVGTDKEVIAELRNQLAEAKKDAERYRWLRMNGESQALVIEDLVGLAEVTLDAAIDQAMREGK